MDGQRGRIPCPSPAHRVKNQRALAMQRLHQLDRMERIALRGPVNFPGEFPHFFLRHAEHFADERG